MATLIDSSVLIAAERGRLQFDEIAVRYSQEDVAISAVTASELLHGVHRARTAAQRHRRQAFVEGLMAASGNCLRSHCGSGTCLALGRFGQARGRRGRT
jgi:uncharacterized protein with PIN domain